MPDIEEIDAKPEAPSLDDVVRAAWNEHAEDSSAKAATPPGAETEVPEAAQDRPRDASGRFLPKAADAPEAAAPAQFTDADQKTEQPAQNSNSAMPPSFLSAEAKAVWSQAPSAIQAALLKRDADANEGGRQWSEQRQQIEQALSPLHQLSQQNGIDWQEGLNRLLNVESGLRDPRTAAQTVATIAQAYGVDLRALVNGTQQPTRAAPQFDPNVIPQIVSRQVSEQLQAYQQDQALNGEINSFAQERGQNGQLTHPHFDAVRILMGYLLQNGQASDMQDAYDKATWATPDIRSQLMTTQAQPQAAAKQVATARRAAVSVKGAPTNGRAPTQGNTSKSLDDAVRAAWEAHAGSAN